MKLTKVRVSDFQSVRDSTEFDIGDVTCLVGKNEAGKTALLQAMYRLRPIVDTDVGYNVTDDYPRPGLRAPRVSEDTQSGPPNPAVSGPPRSILRLASSSNARLQSREYDRRRTRTPAQHGGPGARGPVRGGPQVAFGIAAENTGAQDGDQGRAGGLRSQALASAARGEGR